MRHFKIIFSLLFLFTAIICNAQNHIYKFRVKEAFYSDSLGTMETPIWKSYPDGKDILVVYDIDKKKINGYGKEIQDLSIIKQSTLSDKTKGWAMDNMTCIDQSNRKCDVSLIIYTLPNKQAPYQELIIDYGPIKFKFEMLFD